MEIIRLTRQVLFVCAAFVCLTAPSHAENVVVPNVVGQNYVAAQKSLSAVGLRNQVGVHMYLPPGDPRLGSVLQSTPSAGARVPRGNSVYLMIYGPGIAVPNVVGLHYRDAQTKLRAAGFPPAKLIPGGQVAAGDPKLGIVISQAPTAASVGPRNAIAELRIWVLKPSR
jgi:beta-lactam-binding protein with PASTA domain